MMKSVRISESLYHAADKEAEVMHRSTAGQLEYWASLGRRAEVLLDANIKRALLYATVIDDAQAISKSNNQKIEGLIKAGSLSAESVRFFDKEMIKKSVIDFSGTDF